MNVPSPFYKCYITSYCLLRYVYSRSSWNQIGQPLKTGDQSYSVRLHRKRNKFANSSTGTSEQRCAVITMTKSNVKNEGRCFQIGYPGRSRWRRQAKRLALVVLILQGTSSNSQRAIFIISGIQQERNTTRNGTFLRIWASGSMYNGIHRPTATGSSSCNKVKHTRSRDRECRTFWRYRYSSIIPKRWAKLRNWYTFIRCFYTYYITDRGMPAKAFGIYASWAVQDTNSAILMMWQM